MAFTAIIADIRAKRLAGRRYEKSGNHRFRDCVTVRRDGHFIYERYNYGEAAGLVCRMLADGLNDQGEIAWKYDVTAYSNKTEAPRKLTGMAGSALLFDGQKAEWQPATELKTMPGMGRLRMLFMRNA